MCRGMGVPRVEPQPAPVGQVVETLLRVKRPVLIASAAEGMGRHSSFRGCLRPGGIGLEELQCWAGRKPDKENGPSKKINYREL